MSFFFPAKTIPSLPGPRFFIRTVSLNSILLIKILKDRPSHLHFPLLVFLYIILFAILFVFLSIVEGYAPPAPSSLSDLIFFSFSRCVLSYSSPWAPKFRGASPSSLLTFSRPPLLPFFVFAIFVPADFQQMACLNNKGWCCVAADSPPSPPDFPPFSPSSCSDPSLRLRCSSAMARQIEWTSNSYSECQLPPQQIRRHVFIM